jgi:glycosyltransferase involved in cell wall biosynthesis
MSKDSVVSRSKPKLSICIPTYNRANCLVNCLNSIVLNHKNSGVDYEVCVSDNASTDGTDKVIDEFKSTLILKYFRQNRNVGRVRNYLKVVDMAEGEFIWLLGDDDLLLPEALQTAMELLGKNSDTDFFYINSYNLTTEFVMSYPQPFDTVNLPVDMTTFSNYSDSGRCSFLSLIDPDVSFDFIGAMFLVIFRKGNWLLNVSVLDQQAIDDPLTFSHYDNTFPHVKIFSRAFSKSKAYLHATPLSVNLSGSREWAPMSPLINIVRLVESLDEYRLNGLSFWSYLRFKNFAMRTFIPDYVRMLLHKEESGYRYIQPIRLFMGSIVYPNAWLSPFYYLMDFLKDRLKVHHK